MLINHRSKIISVSVPKTGSTSLHYALMDALGEEFRTKSPFPAVYHMPAADIKRVMGPRKFESYFSFGVVRNPFDRMVSLYHDFRDQRHHIQAKTFDDFILEEFKSCWQNDVHFLPQVFFLYAESEKITSKIYFFESGLDSIINDISLNFDLGEAKIGHARKSHRNPWESYYTNPKVAATVIEHYKVDFETFSYQPTFK